MEEEEVHVPVGRQGPHHLEVAGGQAGQAEDGQPDRQVGEAGVARQTRYGAVEAFRRAGRTDPLAQPPPQLGLPGRLGGQGPAGAVAVAARRPGPEHRGAVHAVAVVEVGHVADRTEAPGPPVGVGVGPGAAQVAGQGTEPRFGQVPVDHVEQRPHAALR
jgi:hypothetical protein